MSLEIGQVLVRVDQPVRGRGRGQTHLSAKNVPNVAQHRDLNIISIFLNLALMMWTAMIATFFNLEQLITPSVINHTSYQLFKVEKVAHIEVHILNSFKMIICNCFGR